MRARLPIGPAALVAAALRHLVDINLGAPALLRRELAQMMREHEGT